MMKKFEIMQELLTCDMETQVSKHFWKNGTDRLAQCRVATNLQFVKKTVSFRPNQAKHSKIRYVCM